MAAGRALPGLVAMLPLLAAACAAAGSGAPARDLNAARAPATAAATRSAPLREGGVQLVGLGGGELERLLGQPALVRSEEDAQYRRYSLGACQLDLFLYADPGGDPWRVTYLDVRPSRHAPPGRTVACANLARGLGGVLAPAATVDTQAEILPGPP